MNNNDKKPMIEEDIDSSEVEMEEIVAKMNSVEREDDNMNKDIEEIKSNPKSYKSVKELYNMAYSNAKK